MQVCGCFGLVSPRQSWTRCLWVKGTDNWSGCCSELPSLVPFCCESCLLRRNPKEACDIPQWTQTMCWSTYIVRVTWGYDCCCTEYRRPPRRRRLPKAQSLPKDLLLPKDQSLMKYPLWDRRTVASVIMSLITKRRRGQGHRKPDWLNAQTQSFGKRTEILTCLSCSRSFVLMQQNQELGKNLSWERGKCGRRHGEEAWDFPKKKFKNNKKTKEKRKNKMIVRF